ncbi:hypothetical protein [uncultured Helicobacter sp.]|uniref:hypothetical protein n=1 Tax=uncultured Helicobacter sp. TaxID=175537 RepID=UPI00262F1221|nr:hypothetical protein [uncultured Helicobacter sp.]
MRFGLVCIMTTLLVWVVQAKPKDSTKEPIQNPTQISIDTRHLTDGEQTPENGDFTACDDLCQAITKRTIVSKDKSAKYFGVGVGASLLNSSKSGNFNINNNVQSPYTNPIIIPSFGVRMGAISFFNRYVGVRGFFGFDMGFGAHSGMLTMISAGVDAIAEFPLSRRRQVFFGGILGMGADAYLYFDKKDYNHWGAMKKAGEVFMQVGFTTMLGIHNRVNLVYRFLPARRASYFSPTGVVSLEYNFLF